MSLHNKHMSLQITIAHKADLQGAHYSRSRVFMHGFAMGYVMVCTPRSSFSWANLLMLDHIEMARERVSIEALKYGAFSAWSSSNAKRNKVARCTTGIHLIDGVVYAFTIC